MRRFFSDIVDSSDWTSRHGDSTPVPKTATMICSICSCEFYSQHHHRVPLTVVCHQCVTSSELVTKTDALSAGASLSDLYSIRRLYAPNPHYRNGADMQLFVREEVDVLVKNAADLRRRKKEEGDHKRVLSEAKQQAVKESRLACLAKRMQAFDGLVPTPGLVAGDYCSVGSKTPRVGVRSLLTRRALWNKLSGVQVPWKVVLFEWAVTNKRLTSDAASLVEGVQHEKHLFDKVANSEGNRILSFLDEVDRLVLMRLHPVFTGQMYGLRVRQMSGQRVYLCNEVARLLKLPFGRVLAKLHDSKNCWIGKYLFVMQPERVALILAPHFHSRTKRQRLLRRGMEECFERWGLDVMEDKHPRIDEVCRYFGGDIVDVELYTAACAILKAKVHYQQAVDAVTNRVMFTPGATWREVTEDHIKEQRETELMRKEDKHSGSVPRVCRCGNASALECVFGQCGRCCRGPCARHHRH